MFPEIALQKLNEQKDIFTLGDWLVPALIGEVHDVWCRTALPVCKADAILKDHIGCVVFPQVCVDDQRTDLISMQNSPICRNMP